MKVVCWHGVNDVRVETVPDPKIINPRDASVVVSHQLPLEQAPHGYHIFQQKEDNCIKVVLKP